MLPFLFDYIPRITFILRAEFSSVLPPQEDLTDIIHDGIMRAFDRGHRYNPALAGVYTFLMMHVRFVMKDFLRATHFDYYGYIESYVQAKAPQCIHVDAPSPRIMRALNQIPTQQRDIVLLYYYQGLSIPLIAEHCDIKEKTVREQLSRAYRTLFTLLGNDVIE